MKMIKHSTIVVGFLLCILAGRMIAQRLDGIGVRVNGAQTITTPMLVTNGTAAAPSIAFTADPTSGIFHDPVYAGSTTITASGASVAQFYPGVFTLLNGAFLGMSATTATNLDIILARDAANVLALKNGTNAQDFRVYGTTTGPKYTSLKNDGTSGILTTSAATPLTLGVGGSGFWEIDNSANLWPTTDNVRDLGVASTNRIHNAFIGTSISLGTNVTFSAAVPTITSGFGTTPSIVGTAAGFRLTLGNPVGQTGVVAFNTTFANPPVVQCGDETSIAGDPIKETPTITNVTLTFTLAVAGDKVACSVTGF